MIRRAAVAVAILFMIGTLWLIMFSWLQRKAVFPGTAGVDTALLHRFANEVGATELQLPTGDGETLYGWHRSATSPGDRRVVLYFHGNASSVLGQLDLQEALVHAGWDFVEFHYRGYPGSTGTATESHVHHDAKKAWDWVVETLDTPPERIVLHGRSLGGGVAAHLASTTNPAALVLESTFTSVLELTSKQLTWLPVSRIIEHPFMTRDVAPNVESPVLVAHGDDDHTINVHHGRELAEIFSADEYIEVPGIDHNNILFHGEYLSRYFDFIDRAVPRVQP